MLADIDNVHIFAHKFISFAQGTKHLQWCSSVHRALLMLMLMSGDVTILAHLQLALFFAHSHFTALVPLSSTTAHTHPIWQSAR